jgi:hypothetical protein
MRHRYPSSIRSTIVAALAVAGLMTVAAPAARADIQVDSWDLDVDAGTFFGPNDAQSNNTVALPLGTTLSAQSIFLANSRDAAIQTGFTVNTSGDDFTWTIAPSATVYNDTTGSSNAFARTSAGVVITPAVASILNVTGAATFNQVTSEGGGIFAASVKNLTDNVLNQFLNTSNLDYSQGTVIDYTNGPIALEAGKQYQLGFYFDVRSNLAAGDSGVALTTISTGRVPIAFTITPGAIPEPSTLSLLAIGAGAMLHRRKR